MKEERLTLISCNDLGWYPTKNFKYLVFMRTEKYVAYCTTKEVCIFIFKKVRLNVKST